VKFVKRNFLKVKAKIKNPIIAGIISRKQVNPSFGFITEATKEIVKMASRE
jgi:putative N-acetylmannosamine-6-phosphate epimerase